MRERQNSIERHRTGKFGTQNHTNQFPNHHPLEWLRIAVGRRMQRLLSEYPFLYRLYFNGQFHQRNINIVAVNSSQNKIQSREYEPTNMEMEARHPSRG